MVNRFAGHRQSPQYRRAKGGAECRTVLFWIPGGKRDDMAKLCSATAVHVVHDILGSVA
jgi:hypothetical protein